MMMRPSLQSNRYTLLPAEYKEPLIDKENDCVTFYTRKEDAVVVDIKAFEYINSKWPYYISNHGQVIRARRRSDKQQYKKYSLIQLSRELFGFPPRNFAVYFLNGNTQDCRVANMRLVEKAESQYLERKRRESKIDKPQPEWEPEDYIQYVDNETYINLRANLNVEDILDIRRKELTAKEYSKKYKTTESVISCIWGQRVYKNLLLKEV